MRRKTLRKQNTRNKKKQLQKMKRLGRTRRLLLKKKRMMGGNPDAENAENALIHYMLANERLDFSNIDLSYVKRLFDSGATGHKKDQQLGYSRAQARGHEYANLLEWVPHKNQETNYNYSDILQPIINHMVGTEKLP